MSNSVERLDPITGAITFTHSLSLRSVQRSSLYDPAVSPDGKKMFLEDLGDIALLNLETGANRILKRGGDGRNFQSVVAATYYGGHIKMEDVLKPGKSLKKPNQMQYMELADRVFWAKDSQSFYEVVMNSKMQCLLLHRSLDDAILSQTVVTEPPNTHILDQLGITDSNKALLAVGYWGVIYCFYQVDLKTLKVTSFPVKYHPKYTEMRENELSPDGKKIVWRTETILETAQSDRIVSLFHYAIFHREGKHRISIQISDLDGSNMKELCGEEMTGNEENGVQTIHWTPDSKRISFWYNQAIYTIPAK